MKKILKIFLCLTLGCVPLLLFSCAHAEEVELTPVDSWDYEVHFQNNTDDFYLTTDSTMNYPVSYTDPSSPSHRLLLGDFLCGSSQVAYIAGYDPNTDTSGYSPFPYSYQGCYPYYYLNNAFNTPVDFPSFTLTFHDSTLSLDCSNLTSGWYRYEVEFYLGVAVGGYGTFSPAPPSFEPTFTYLTDQIPLGVNGVIYYAGTEDLSTGDSSSPMFGTKLVHFHFEDTFEVDPQVGTYEWNVTPAFQYLISGLQYQGFSVLKRQGIAVYGNSRFASSLYGNVAPIVSPTTIPTPSPNQDIINTNNTNTTNIISNINSGFDSLVGIIQSGFSGIGTLLFGSVGDWLDFFSDIQSDIADDIPVVTFFNELQNIFANFFSIDQTDPSTLQYVAGWQSDIYTLHVNALPLVLPSGTYDFFPEVNFNLNNPFMNEIRPYWLTFSNVLISLLFLRYLANYLFRWSQLLTGDTSVAFQLFHHSPDELEDLGTDPDDLASDYSFDSIDSENHDLYQDAERHYGHGAARYLSKVFHSK